MFFVYNLNIPPDLALTVGGWGGSTAGNTASGGSKTDVKLSISYKLLSILYL